jgi:prolipoprotein diacylglyceryltransferase
MSELDWTPQRVAYLAFMSAALVVFVAVRHLQPRAAGGAHSLPLEDRLLLSLAAFLGGMLSAKLPFVLSGLFDAAPGSLWISDGKTVTTGLAGAYAMVELTKRMLGIRIKTGDAYAIPLAMALAIGRLGCFFNGCCYGNPTQVPWGVDFFGDGPRHPTQLYETAFHASMAGLLLVLATGDRLRTHRLQFYLIAYCFYRFVSEYYRPEPVWLLGMTFYQVFVVVFGAALVAQWIWEAHREATKNAVTDSIATMPPAV